MPFSVVGFPLFSVRARAWMALCVVGLPACLAYRVLVALSFRRRRLFRVKFRFRLEGLISHEGSGDGGRGRQK